MGCESFKKAYLQEPKAELKEVQIRDASFAEATLIFVLEVKNPNKAELKISDVSYQTFLNDEFFGEAKVSKTQIIPAEQTGIVELPLQVLYSKVAGGLVKILKGESVDYRIKGDAKVSAFRIPFDKSGKLNINKK